MGVEGLHRVLEAYMKETNLKDIEFFKGERKRVGVDAYTWLFKCRGEMMKHPEYTYIDYVDYMCKSLNEIGMDLVLVFDGSTPSIKRDEDQTWPPRPNLDSDFDRSRYISTEVIHNVVLNMKHRKIDVIVAPYEADAQLAYMAINNHIQAIISEDSDLFPYMCPRVIYKLVVPSMECKYFEYEWNDRTCKFPLYSNKVQYEKIDFKLLPKNMFVPFCIICETDYMRGIYGVEPAKAFELIKGCRDLEQLFVKLRNLYRNGVPIERGGKYIKFEDYMSKFKKVIDTYEHQRVYCPTTKEIRFLRNCSSSSSEDCDKDYLGAHIEKHKAIKIAEGVNNPITGDAFLNDVRYKVRDINVKNVEHIKKTREEEFKEDITTSEPKKKKQKFVDIRDAFKGKKI